MKAEAEVVRGVTFKHYVPQGPLADFVELFWFWNGYHQEYGKERLMPMGSVELVIQLENARPSASGLSGPRSESLIIERTDQDRLLGIHFKPGGAFPFLQFPYGDLHNSAVTLDELWGDKRARRLLNLLHEAGTVDRQFQVLEGWLTWIAARPLRHHAAVSFAISKFRSDPSLSRSAGVAEATGLSQRRFIELFRNEVGMTPKLFCRVERFQTVIRNLEQTPDVNWVDIALSCGYSDQSHFNHDFREFSGVRPSDYLSLRLSQNHIQHLDPLQQT
jgi:AraC-like DNA-binding protein